MRKNNLKIQIMKEKMRKNNKSKDFPLLNIIAMFVSGQCLSQKVI